MIYPFECEIDGLKIRGWRRPGSGPRCLAVHGWLDNGGSFSRLVEYLPDWDFLAIDLPGHGRSQWLPRSGFYHFIDGVYWITQLARQWNPRLLMGHSLGGGLCSMVASVLADSIAGAVLLDALGPITSPADEARQLFLRSLQSRDKPFHRRYYPSYEEALQRLQQEGRSPEAARALAERSLMCDGNGYYFTYDPRVKAVSRARLTKEQIQAYLREIPCPVQVYSFSQGLLPGFAPLSERLACLKHGQLVEMEGGHHHHLEQPQQVAERIRPFAEALCGQ